MAVVERLREPTAIALAKGDNSFTLAKARVLQAWLAHREIKTLLPIVLERYKDRISDENGAEEADFEFGIVPVRLKALLDEPASIEEEKEEKRRALDIAKKRIEQQERDEHQALEEGAPDLIRLERYARRAWSRQKRAIRSFMNVKLMHDLSNEMAISNGAPGK